MVYKNNSTYKMWAGRLIGFRRGLQKELYMHSVCVSISSSFPRPPHVFVRPPHVFVPVLRAHRLQLEAAAQDVQNPIPAYKAFEGEGLLLSRNCEGDVCQADFGIQQ
jgi:hypothetical protein